jgi:hypothetical protein
MPHTLELSLRDRRRRPWQGLALVALLDAGCAEVVATEGAEQVQERCFAGVTSVEQAMQMCPDGSLDPVLQGIFKVGRNNWNPQNDLGNPNRYVERYGGHTLTSVLVVSVDPKGRIAAIDLAKSSGEEAVDGLALSAFLHADGVSDPPACALREGMLRLKVDMCMEVERPRRWRWKWVEPAMRIESPTLEAAPAPKMTVSDPGSNLGR